MGGGGGGGGGYGGFRDPVLPNFRRSLTYRKFMHTPRHHHFSSPGSVGLSTILYYTDSRIYGLGNGSGADFGDGGGGYGGCRSSDAGNCHLSFEYE